MEMVLCVFYANCETRWLIYNGFRCNWRQRELIKGKDIIEWYRLHRGGSACSALYHSMTVSHYISTKHLPPLIMSIFHEEGPVFSVSGCIFPCAEPHIILHLAKSCIDPELYLISMHYNVLCTVQRDVPEPFGNQATWEIFFTAWMLHNMNCNASPSTI